MKVVVFHFRMFGINTYLVYDPESKEAAVVDPGMSSPEEEKAIVKFIEENHLTLKYIINTHLHIDHAIGNRFLVEKFQTPVLADEEEEVLGKSMQMQAASFGLIGKYEPVEVTQKIKPGDVIKLGDEELKVIDVSGHSPGGIALYCEKDNFVIVGDALFKRSIGRTDLYGADHESLLKNIRKNLFTLPGDTLVLPGHGDPTTIGEEKKLNPFLNY